MKSWQKRLIQSPIFVVVCAVICAVAFEGLELWNKSRFCHGWAESYRDQATQWREKSRTPDLSTAEINDCLAGADLYELIARKYALVASRPWLPYPGYPLVSAGEQFAVRSRYEIVSR